MTNDGTTNRIMLLILDSHFYGDGNSIDRMIKLYETRRSQIKLQSMNNELTLDEFQTLDGMLIDAINSLGDVSGLINGLRIRIKELTIND